MHMFDGMGGGWWMMTVWWVIIIAAIVLLVRFITTNRAIQPPQISALDILKERYARGEISKEEFREMKKDLLE